MPKIWMKKLFLPAVMIGIAGVSQASELVKAADAAKETAEGAQPPLKVLFIETVGDNAIVCRNCIGVKLNNVELSNIVDDIL